MYLYKVFVIIFLGYFFVASSYATKLYDVEVKQYDTVYSIAMEKRVPVKKLISINQLDSPYVIKVGQKLKLPVGVFHLVTNGDTLSSVARKFQIDSKKLAKFNDLKEPYSLTVGQYVEIPNKLSGSTEKSEFVPEPILKETETEVARSEKFVPIPKLKPERDFFTSLEIQLKKGFSSDRPNKFIWPARGNIISRFGPKSGGLFNDGINIEAPLGTEFFAAEDGEVVYSGNELKGYGNLILIRHNDNYISAYAHADEILVKKGDWVKKGVLIGKMGKTGNVATPQLHFSIRKGKKAVDPEKYLSHDVSNLE